MSQPEPSKRLVDFARPYGRCFTTEETTWKEILGPSLVAADQHWARFKQYQNQFGDVFDFELAYIENKSFPNALCGHDHGSHFCLTYHTTPMVLLEFFNRLLSDPFTLRSIGEPAKESGRFGNVKKVPGYSVFSGETKISQVWDVITVFGPKCPLRRSAAMDMFHFAMSLCWHHEIAHALNGHVQFVGGAQNLPLYAQNRSETYGLTEKELCFLEKQADSGAMFAFIVSPLLDVPIAVTPEDADWRMKMTAQRIMAGALMCWTWAIPADALAGYGAWTDHPSTLSRMLYYVLSPSGMGKKLPPQGEKILKEASSIAFNELISLAQVGLFRPFNWLRKDDMWEKIFSSFVLSEEERSTLIKKLTPYRFAKPPPSVSGNVSIEGESWVFSPWGDKPHVDDATSKI